jgi:hypothetical protein
MDIISNYKKYTKALDEKWDCFSYVSASQHTYTPGYVNTEVDSSFNREELTEWCSKQCKGDWCVIGGTVFFKEKKDSMMFRLMYAETNYHNGETNIDINNNDFY